MSLIVYGDFCCPECYLAAARVDALAAAGVPVDWRAVEHDPGIAVAGQRLSGPERDALGARVAALQALLLPRETLPWSSPSLRPKTEAAVSAYAEACGAGVGDDVRRVLFDLYWRHGADIGNPNVLRGPLAGPMLRSRSGAAPLRDFGYAVSVDRAPITTAAYRKIRQWRDELRDHGSMSLPLVLTGGATLCGIDALRRLGKEIAYAGVDPAPRLLDPHRYPRVAVRPSMSWVSQIGGPWANAYRRPEER